MSLEMWDDDDDDDDEPDDGQYQDDEPPLDLGPCCACGRGSPLGTGEYVKSEGNYVVVETVEVRNIGMMSFRAPVAGSGWGCLQCGLPQDGALAIYISTPGYEPGNWIRAIDFEDGFRMRRARVEFGERVIVIDDGENDPWAS